VNTIEGSEPHPKEHNSSQTVVRGIRFGLQVQPADKAESHREKLLAAELSSAHKNPL